MYSLRLCRRTYTSRSIKFIAFQYCIWIFPCYERSGSESIRYSKQKSELISKSRTIANTHSSDHNDVFPSSGFPCIGGTDFASSSPAPELFSQLLSASELSWPNRFFPPDCFRQASGHHKREAKTPPSDKFFLILGFLQDCQNGFHSCCLMLLSCCCEYVVGSFAPYTSFIFLFLELTSASCCWNSFTRNTDAPKYVCLFLLVILKAGKGGN